MKAGDGRACEKVVQAGGARGWAGRKEESISGHGRVPSARPSPTLGTAPIFRISLPATVAHKDSQDDFGPETNSEARLQ